MLTLYINIASVSENVQNILFNLQTKIIQLTDQQKWLKKHQLVEINLSLYICHYQIHFNISTACIPVCLDMSEQ